MAAKRSDVPRRRLQNAGAAGEATGAGAADPGTGAGGGAVLAKLPQFHPEPAEDVVALAAICNGPRPPLRAARGYLDDAFAGRAGNRVDPGLIRLAPRAPGPALDVGALAGPVPAPSTSKPAVVQRRLPPIADHRFDEARAF